MMLEVNEAIIRNRNYLTTGQVARICEVTARTISKWCDSGLLVCHRLPSSQERRIARDDFVRFLIANNMPQVTKLQAIPAVFITPDRDLFLLIKVKADESKTPLEMAGNFVEGGFLLARFRPLTVVIDVSCGHREDTTHFGRIAEDTLGYRPRMIAVLPEDDNRPRDFMRNGFEVCFRRPVDPQEVADILPVVTVPATSGACRNLANGKQL